MPNKCDYCPTPIDWKKDTWIERHTPGKSASPLSIVPGTPEVVGSAVNRPTIAIGPGEIPVKLPATPETPITKSVLMVPGSVLPGSVLDVQVKVFCCSSWPDPRIPVASNSTMRPWRPFESIAKSYVGDPVTRTTGCRARSPTARGRGRAATPASARGRAR